MRARPPRQHPHCLPLGPRPPQGALPWFASLVSDPRCSGRLDEEPGCGLSPGPLCFCPQRLAGATLLIFANKQDLPGALSSNAIREVSSGLGADSREDKRHAFICYFTLRAFMSPCCAAGPIGAPETQRPVRAVASQPGGGAANGSFHRVAVANRERFLCAPLFAWFTLSIPTATS